jgi:hypothetical protein
MGNNLKWLVAVIGSVCLILLIVGGALPMIQAVIEHTQDKTLEQAGEYWESMGYVAYTDPSGILHVNSVEPNADDTYDLGTAILRFKNIYGMDVYVDGTLYQGGFAVPKASGNPDYVVGVNTATDDVPGATGYWVKSGATGQVIETNASAVVSIQYALDTAAGVGTHQKVTLIGDFPCSTIITPKSNVDVELQGSITITMTSATISINFNNIINSIWSGGTITRAGTINPVGMANTMQFVGACDQTLVIRDMEVISTIVCATTEQNGAIRIMTLGVGVTDPSPTFINVTARASSGATGPVAAGWLVGGFGNTPYFNNCVGYGGGGNMNEGWFFQDGTKAIGDNIKGYGGTVSVVESDGITIWDMAEPTLNSPIGYGGNGGTIAAGIRMTGGASKPVLNSPIGIGGWLPYAGGKNAGIMIENSASPIINNGFGGPQTKAQWFSYDDANNGRFRPFATYRYQLVSLYIYIWASDMGTTTLDIGTTVGGHEIAQNINCNGEQWVFPIIATLPVAANGYLYVTPSAPVADDKFFIGYTVAYDSGHQIGLVLDTIGAAKIVGGTYIGTYNGFGVEVGTVGVTSTRWSINNATLDNYNDISETYHAGLNYIPTMADVPIYNCTFKGQAQAVLSFAKGSNNSGIGISSSGTWTVANGQNHVHITHSLAWTPQAGDIAIGFTTLDASTACFIDGYSATEFVVHVNVAATANTTTGWWKAIR